MLTLYVFGIIAPAHALPPTPPTQHRIFNHGPWQSERHHGGACQHLLKVPTRADLRAAIPDHCFERSALHGFVYIARDLLLVAGFAYFANTFLSVEFPGLSDPAAALKWFVGWNFYAF